MERIHRRFLAVLARPTRYIPDIDTVYHEEITFVDDERTF